MSKIVFVQRARQTHFGWDWFSEDYGNDKLKHVATARPLLLGGAERGVSIRRVIRYSVALRNSARNRFLLTVTQIRLTLQSGQPGCKPFLRAPVGSNTETDDDCRPATFHRGRFRCEAPFSIPTLTQEKPPTSVRSLYVAVNRATI